MGLFDKLTSLFSKKEQVADASFVSPNGILGEYASPMEGLVKPLSECSDSSFSSGIWPGVVIVPTGNQVFAPAAGVVDTLFHTRHALVLRLENGLEMVIHVGIDTVNLEGEGFTAHVEAGDTVRQGQLLLTFDPEVLKAKGYSNESPIIVVNADELSDDKYEVEAVVGQVKVGEPAFRINKA